MITEKFKKDMAGREITKQEGNFSLLMFGSVVPGCFSPYIEKYYNFDFGSFIFIVKDRHGTIFFDLKNYQKVTTATYGHFLAAGNEENLPEYRDYVETGERIAKFYDTSRPETLVGLSDDGLDVTVKDAFGLIARLLAATVFCESLDESLVHEYYREARGNEESFAKFFATASKATFESFAVRLDKALLGQKAEDPAKLQWLFTDYYTAPQIADVTLLAARMVASKNGIEKIAEELEKNLAELEKNRREVELLRGNLPEAEKHLLDFMQLSMNVRDRRREPLQKVLSAIANITREIFRRKDIPREDAVLGYASDFTGGKYRNEGYAAEIAKRKPGIVGYINASGCELEYGNAREAEDELYALMGGAADGGIIKGNVGCKGNARGKVRVVANENDFSKFEDGEVLVTSMTRPEFVPLMKRAVAVVTDEGGITCHAAIISRELGKPCVIGTKTATKILHDGDEVEVDAEKGLVKIIVNK